MPRWLPHATVPNADALKAIPTSIWRVNQTSHATLENTFAKLAANLLKKAGAVNFINDGGETPSIVVQELSFTGGPYR